VQLTDANPVCVGSIFLDAHGQGLVVGYEATASIEAALKCNLAAV
jgi:hypothetical protein